MRPRAAFPGAETRVKLLAFDTATDACSAAVCCDGASVYRYAVAPRGHTALLLPMIEAVLAETGLHLAQLDGIAFGRGPGAFVGVRIAAAVAQGLAFAADLPVVPVSTLAALARQAWRVHGAERVAAALDARMGEVYWGTYRATGSGDVVAVGDERVCPPAAVPAPAGDDWVGIGSGWDVCAEALRAACPVRAQLRDAQPHALDVAALGVLRLARGEGVAAEHAQPVYLRDEVAQTLAARAAAAR